MRPSVAFVGAGPTTLYTLSSLLAHVGSDARISVFEEAQTAGSGTPYRPDWNDPAMLANIASIEIPPITETLLAWLERQPATELEGMGVAANSLDERAFYPRVVLGRYFRDQFDALVEKGRARGLQIDVQTRCKVVDVRNVDAGCLLTVLPSGDVARQMMFDHVVLATGHQWPMQQQVRPGYFLSPWPVTALAATPPVSVGIRGSSLTAIDTAVALAASHGAFVRGDPGLAYAPAAGTDGFAITMMSRKGLLPEADFFFPLPHAPLSICTPEAIDELVEAGGDTLLDAAFDLFKRELQLIDPVYSETHALDRATLEAFSESYFAARAAADPFEWAAANLAEARQNHEAEVTVPWRDAILRMHEVIAVIVPRLNPTQFQRFSRLLKPVFVDAYGAVPHESIERMLALHQAGKLEIVALGDDYELDTHRPEGGVVLHLGAEQRHFPVFIESTGQRPLSALQFPFLSLLEQGVVRDVANGDEANSPRGVVIDEAFRVIADGIPAGRLFCLSLPFIMGRHPFVQGICSSHEMGEIVGEVLSDALGRRSATGLHHPAQAA